MQPIKIIKKDGRTEDWIPEKILKATEKAATRAGVHLSYDQRSKVEGLVWMWLCGKGINPVPVEDVHNLVEKALAIESAAAAESYMEYRGYRKDIVRTWEETYEKTKSTLYSGDRENANFNSSLISTKGSLVRGHLTKALYKQFYLTKDELAAIELGYIYIHDLRDLVFGGVNCCLFDMATVLKGGFEMAGVKYKEPKSVLSALQVIGDITLVATAQQYGGFTIAELDKVLVPYAQKSYKTYVDEAFFLEIKHPHRYANEKMKAEICQGLQSLEMKLNTVPSSRGDTAFVTVTFGNCDDPLTDYWQRPICHAILDTRMNGQGNGSPVVFPKLVYLHSEKQHESKEQQDLFDHAVLCSSKCMYPDYLSLDNSEVGEIFHRTGKVVSPMGCRAYLSDYQDAQGESFFVGRANIGAVSLNLPMIYKESDGTDVGFKILLKKYLEIIRGFLKRRYEAVADNPCSTNPLAFTQGGFVGGTKELDDKVGMDIVKSFTASFGITALNELNVLKEGKELHESDQHWVTSIIHHIDSYVKYFKKEDGYLYALYATPAESLAGTQLRQFRDKFGVIPKVSDKEYFSNGFHCPVTASITPFQKQDKEHKLYHKINGGHIQYVRIDNRDNLTALHTVIKRGMRMGFYQGVNFDLVVCTDCGHRPSKLLKSCPECGSEKLKTTVRVCGYLGDLERFNDAKLSEVEERVSM